MSQYEVLTTIISAVSFIAFVVTRFNTISVLKDKVAKLEQNVEILQQQRAEDVLSFTQVLGQFNVTLVRFEGTLKHLNVLITDVKNKIDKLEDNDKHHGKRS